MGSAMWLTIEAIERHRDRHWPGGAEVKDPADAELYDVAVWARSQQQEIEIEEGPAVSSADDSSHAYERDPE
jgi:hypothetical protein